MFLTSLRSHTNTRKHGRTSSANTLFTVVQFYSKSFHSSIIATNDHRNRLENLQSQSQYHSRWRFHQFPPNRWQQASVLAIRSLVSNSGRPPRTFTIRAIRDSCWFKTTGSSCGRRMAGALTTSRSESTRQLSCHATHCPNHPTQPQNQSYYSP